MIVVGDQYSDSTKCSENIPQVHSMIIPLKPGIIYCYFFGDIMNINIGINLIITSLEHSNP